MSGSLDILYLVNKQYVQYAVDLCTVQTNSTSASLDALQCVHNEYVRLLGFSFGLYTIDLSLCMGEQKTNNISSSLDTFHCASKQ